MFSAEFKQPVPSGVFPPGYGPGAAMPFYPTALSGFVTAVKPTTTKEAVLEKTGVGERDDETCEA